MDWSIGVNVDDQLVVMHNDEIVVGFTTDYTYELYMALDNHFKSKNFKSIN